MQPALLWKTGNRKKAAKSILKIFFPINSAINRTTVARNDWVFTELLLVLSGCVLESQRSCSKPCRSLPSAEKECAWRSRSLYQIASNRHYLLSCSSWGGSWHNWARTSSCRRPPARVLSCPSLERHGECSAIADVARSATGVPASTKDGLISSVHLVHFLVDSGYSQITTTALDGSRVATNTDGAYLLESIKHQMVRNSATRGNAWKRSVPTSTLWALSLCTRCPH